MVIQINDIFGAVLCVAVIVIFCYGLTEREKYEKDDSGDREL